MRGKRILATITALMLLLALSGCGKTAGGYQLGDAGLGERRFAVGCREGDPLLDVLIAALQVCKANGTTARLGTSWFGSDLTELKGDAEALSGLEIAPERVLLVGYDESAFPFAGSDEKGKPRGFELELAESVCELLGWELRALPVDPAQLAVELASGEVDCVWGGISLESASGVRALQYMKAEYVLLSRAEAPVKNIRGLQGKAVSYPPFLQKAVEDAGIPEKAATCAKLADTQACLAAMNAGRCDAVLTDAVSAAYFTR